MYINPIILWIDLIIVKLWFYNVGGFVRLCVMLVFSGLLP
jgi:hypothetical protein